MTKYTSHTGHTFHCPKAHENFTLTGQEEQVSIQTNVYMNDADHYTGFVCPKCGNKHYVVSERDGIHTCYSLGTV